MAEEFRMQYPLDARALILDAGAYHGDFMDWCRDRWGCTIYGFEPVRVFYEDTKMHVRPPAQLFNYGLGSTTRVEALHIRADSSSIFFGREVAKEEQIQIELRDVLTVFADLAIEHVDLFKINIEGGEYELFDRMFETGLVSRVRFFQVQFHGGVLNGAGPVDADAQRLRIREKLTKTHKEQWCAGKGQWESWERL